MQIDNKQRRTGVVFLAAGNHCFSFPPQQKVIASSIPYIMCGLFLVMVNYAWHKSYHFNYFQYSFVILS